VVFRLPEETVLAMWRRAIGAAYAPEAIYRRFAYNLAHTFRRRPQLPRSPYRSSRANVISGLVLIARIIWKIGVRGDYRRTFWRLAGPALRRGQLEELTQAAVVSHHLIEFTRQCLRGIQEASFYAPTRPAAAPAPTLEPLRLRRSPREHERVSR